MKINLTLWQKLFIAAFCFSFAVIGFMIKLPSAFRQYDKELHTAFYFLAAAFLNLLFARRHVVIFIFLYLFGMCIEFSQEYSNKLFKTRIHGRYDPEDIQSNLKGLIAFSIVWCVYHLIRFVIKRNTVQRNQATE
jgi:hypothetical protein